MYVYVYSKCHLDTHLYIRWVLIPLKVFHLESTRNFCFHLVNLAVTLKVQCYLNTSQTRQYSFHSGLIHYLSPNIAREHTSTWSSTRVPQGIITLWVLGYRCHHRRNMLVALSSGLRLSGDGEVESDI